MKGVQNFCFCQLSMQILWRRRCSRVVDLKLPNVCFHEPFDVLSVFSCAQCPRGFIGLSWLNKQRLRKVAIIFQTTFV